MDQKAIGQFIARLRREKGLTQEELGVRLGVGNKTVSRWENGNYMPDIALLQPLSSSLGVDVNELLSARRLAVGEEFRAAAEGNLLAALETQKRLLRRKRLADFFEGGGAGILLSALAMPDASFRRGLTAAVGAAMLCAGWLLRARLERALLGGGTQN